MAAIRAAEVKERQRAREIRRRKKVEAAASAGLEATPASVRAGHPPGRRLAAGTVSTLAPEGEAQGHMDGQTEALSPHQRRWQRAHESRQRPPQPPQPPQPQPQQQQRQRPKLSPFGAVAAALSTASSHAGIGGKARLAPSKDTAAGDARHNPNYDTTLMEAEEWYRLGRFNDSAHSCDYRCDTCTHIILYMYYVLH